MSPIYNPPVLDSSDLLYGIESGAANAYIVTLSPPLTSMQTGQLILFKPINTNTGASTVNVNGLGNTPIKKNGSTALEDGDIVAGQIAQIVYDGTNYQLLNSANLPAPLSGNGGDFTNNTLSFLDVTGRSVTVEANSNYICHLHVYLFNSSIDSAEFKFVAPAGATINGVLLSFRPALNQSSFTDINTLFPANASVAASYIITAVLSTAATAGTFKIQLRKTTTADALNVAILSGSGFTLTKL